MSGHNAARNLLIMARKDLKTLRGILDPDLFEEEMAGFHAQQAVEKALKAWLSILGATYPQTHDLRALIVLLENEGVAEEELWDFVELNPFAARFRYEPYELDDGFDAAESVERIESLLARTETLLQESKR